MVNERRSIALLALWLWLALAGGAMVCCARPARALSSKGARFMSSRYEGRVRAPELKGGRGWLNTDKPLSLAALKGKIVLLDFWAYGCINCIYIIPDLKRLEAKYASQISAFDELHCRIPLERFH
jgi:hypothetical protein